MIEKIKEELKKLEEKENIKIIYAVESGSRAWGFEGIDSDYDIRFIYVRKEEFYLKLEEVKDVIEYQINDALDITGWDIRKALKLLHNSNPSLCEWFESPIIYIENTDILNHLRVLYREYFSINKISRHYYNMAKNQEYKYMKNIEEVNVKKYFYVLRGIFSAKYVIDKKELPPIQFDKLRKEIAPENINNIIEEMLEIKRNSKEVQVIKKNKELDKYIESLFSNVENEIKVMPKEKEKGWKLLDEKFIKIIKIIN